MSWVPYPLDVDPQRLIAQMLADWISRGYAGDQTDPATALIEVFGTRTAETRAVLVDFSAAAYAAHGTKIYGITPIAAAPATVQTTWTLADTLGHTIPAGTRVTFQVTGDQKVAFQVVDDVIVDPGDGSAVGVELEALIPGTAANGITAGTTLMLTDSLSWVTAVTSTSDTAGGVDAETSLEYLERLVTAIRYSSTGGLVLPADFANAARQVVGVHRALAIDGYNPVDETTGNERRIHVVVADDTGAAVDAGVKATVEADLEAKREANFIVTVGDPDINAIAVVFTATAEDGVDEVVVEALAEQAVLDHLDAASYGPQTLGNEWQVQPTIRYFKLVEIIESTPGVASLDTLTVNGTTADVVMTGVAPLPDPTVDGTVT